MTLHQIKLSNAEQRWLSQAKEFRRRYQYLDQEPQTAFTLRRLRLLRNQIKFKKMVFRVQQQNYLMKAFVMAEPEKPTTKKQSFSYAAA